MSYDYANYSQAYDGAMDDGYGYGADAAAAADAYADETVTQEDCWAVIAAYFEDKTLVSQQIDSFDEFVNNTMQELVDESGSLILDQNMQHTGKQNDQTKRYELNFGQIYLSPPTQTEADGTVAPMFPNEARLRNLTCVLSFLPLFVLAGSPSPARPLPDTLPPSLAATRHRSTSTSRSASSSRRATSPIPRRASSTGSTRTRRRQTARATVDRQRRRSTSARCVLVSLLARDEPPALETPSRALPDPCRPLARRSPSCCRASSASSTASRRRTSSS